MNVVKKPECSCYGGFDCKVCNPDYYEEMKTTDTPRTDASLNTHSMINRQKWCDKCGGFVESIYAGNPMFCRCDPRADRIKKLEAEVERLKSDKTHLITQCANLLEELSEIKETYASIVQQPHFDEREVHCSCVPALRAEVERLSKLTEDCLNVIRVYCPTYYQDAMERFNKTDK